MQRRLLVSTLAVAVAAVLLLGIPLGFVLGRQQANDARAELIRRGQRPGARASRRGSANGLPVPVRQCAGQLHDRYVIVTENNGKPVRIGVRPPKGQRVGEHGQHRRPCGSRSGPTRPT